jgi:SulP family sulfate permease
MTIAPTNVLMLLVGVALASYEHPDPPLPLFTLTVMVGIWQVLFGVFRLGKLTEFVSNAVILGFVTGVAVLIMLGQLDHLTGYPIQVEGNTLVKAWDWLIHLPESHLETTFLGIVSIVMIYGLHHTRLKYVATLVAIVVTGGLVTVLSWTEVALVRDMAVIPAGLPAPVLPDMQYVLNFLPITFSIAILASIQSAAIINNMRDIDGTTPRMSWEFLAQGIANIFGGIFQALPASGSLSRTAVNLSAGAKTRLANLFSGVFIAIFLVSAGAVLEAITLPALAGHLIVAAATMIDYKAIRLVWRVRLSARIAMVSTFLATLILPLEYSIFVGIILSLALYLYSSAHNITVVRLLPTDEHHYRVAPIPEKVPCDEPLVLSVSGNLYFAAVPRLEQLLPAPIGCEHPVVILRLRDNPYLGSTGIKMLERYARRLHEKGGKLILSGISPAVQQQLESTNAIERLGRENIFYEEDIIFSATEKALAYAQTWLRSLATPIPP